MTEILHHLYFSKTFTLVGLWTVAEGWVRNRVGNLLSRSRSRNKSRNRTRTRTRTRSATCLYSRGQDWRLRSRQ